MSSSSGEYCEIALFQSIPFVPSSNAGRARRPIRFSRRFPRPGARRRGGATREQALTAPPAAQARAAGTVIPDLQADPSFNVLDGHVDAHSSQFRESTEYMAGLTEELQAMLDRVRRGGGERAVERHRSRGKLLPRERIDAVLDAECVPAARRAAR